MAGNEWIHEDNQILPDIEIREPDRYQVILHNDDYTTMNFVVEILQTIFHKNANEARAIMLKIHEYGTGLCGTFTCEIAETKVRQVRFAARSAGFPLKCTMEKI